MAQTGQTEARKMDDFVVRCLPVQNPSPCDMYQEVGNQQTGQRLVTLSIVLYALRQPPHHRDQRAAGRADREGRQ